MINANLSLNPAVLAQLGLTENSTISEVLRALQQHSQSYAVEANKSAVVISGILMNNAVSFKWEFVFRDITPHDKNTSSLEERNPAEGLG